MKVRFGDIIMPSKSKSALLPKIFKRGKKGYYYFRRYIKGKDKWICTQTSDQKTAIEFTSNYIDAETVTSAVQKNDTNARKLSHAFVETLTNKPQGFTSFEDAYQVWIDHFTHFCDLSDKTRKHYKTIFDAFMAWCKEHDVEYIEAVDSSVAIRYSKYLWEHGNAGSTYNAHIRHLSRVFRKIDSTEGLTNHNPFNHDNIPRIKKKMLGTIGHEPLEPDMLEAVLNEAAKAGRAYRDLFIISSQTGMRLIDAALLKWKSIDKDFLEFKPKKTLKSDNTARVPISAVLRQTIEDHKEESKVYIIPEIAEHYIKNPDYVVKKCRTIFINALGEDKINISAANMKHRKQAAVIYSFHSFRTTFMSLLASKDVSTRDAKLMMAWESSEMIDVYEKMLNKARSDSDARTMTLVNSIDELDYKIPEVVIPPTKLKPTEKALKDLVAKYNNTNLGEIYGFSEAAVRKHLKKHGIVREQHIASVDMTEAKILEIRKDLMEGVKR
jgi:integrase